MPLIHLFRKRVFKFRDLLRIKDRNNHYFSKHKCFRKCSNSGVYKLNHYSGWITEKNDKKV